MSTIGKPDMNRPAIERRFVGIDRYTFLSGYTEAADPVTGEVTTQETTQKTTQERILALLRISPHLTRRRNIESRGRGIERINRKCLAHGIDAPIHNYSLSGLMLTFRASPQHLLDALGPQDVRRIAGNGLGEKLGETRTAIINAMLSNARVTAVELARTLQISTTAVEKNLRILKEQGHIERIGPPRAAIGE